MEFTRAKKVTNKSSDEEIRRRLLNWPDAYYREREPEIRLRMLEEAENQGLTPEDNVIRRELYEIRYPSKGNIKDKYLSAWMNMRFMTERNNGVIFRRHDPKKVRDVLGEIGIGVRMDDRRYQQLLFQEIYHLGMLYGALCCGHLYRCFYRCRLSRCHRCHHRIHIYRGLLCWSLCCGHLYRRL